MTRGLMLPQERTSDESPRRTRQLPCEGGSAPLFFSEDPDEVEAAKSLCGACPRQPDCLAGAVARREPWGVWGGRLFKDGRVIQRRRPPGRPRKESAALART